MEGSGGWEKRQKKSLKWISCIRNKCHHTGAQKNKRTVIKDSVQRYTFACMVIITLSALQVYKDKYLHVFFPQFPHQYFVFQGQGCRSLCWHCVLPDLCPIHVCCYQGGCGWRHHISCCQDNSGELWCMKTSYELNMLGGEGEVQW